MFNTRSSKSRYVLAALVGATAGGVLVALTTRAVPKLMSEMEAKCKQMMAGMARGGCEGGDTCQRMMAGMGQAPEQGTCHA